MKKIIAAQFVLLICFAFSSITKRNSTLSLNNIENTKSSISGNSTKVGKEKTNTDEKNDKLKANKLQFTFNKEK